MTGRIGRGDPRGNTQHDPWHTVRAQKVITDIPFLLVSLAAPCGMGDLSSPTRDQTYAPLQGKCGVLTTGPPGKSQ